MKNLVVLTGAGISEESGISTFRGSNGLWEGHDIMEVASPQGWQKDKNLVNNFYNLRRKQLFEVQPNNAHKLLVELEKNYNVTIITQNVDDLHERAGSTNVVHLHGELKKVRSTLDPNLIYELENWEVKIGDKCEKGSQLRPHIVWFGEEVPMMEKAVNITMQADIFVVIGTSLEVYPAASLINYVEMDNPKFIIDPKIPKIGAFKNLTTIEEKATIGVKKLIENLIL